MTAVYVALLAPALAALVGFLGGRRWPRLVVPVAVAGTTVVAGRDGASWPRAPSPTMACSKWAASTRCRTAAA